VDGGAVGAVAGVMVGAVAGVMVGPFAGVTVGALVCGAVVGCGVSPGVGWFGAGVGCFGAGVGADTGECVGGDTGECVGGMLNTTVRVRKRDVSSCANSASRTHRASRLPSSTKTASAVSFFAFTSRPSFCLARSASSGKPADLATATRAT
jgi:hypothetical protein